MRSTDLQRNGQRLTLKAAVDLRFHIRVSTRIERHLDQRHLFAKLALRRTVLIAIRTYHSTGSKEIQSMNRKCLERR